MPKLLPFIPSESFYQFATTLEETEYIFDVRWNERDSAWYFDLTDISGEAILHGAKLVQGANLLRRYRWDPRCPQGVLLLLDSAKTNIDAGYDDIGTRVQAFYFSAAEVEEINAA